VNARAIEQAKPQVEKLKAYLEEARRDKGSFGIEPRLNLNVIGPDDRSNFIRAWEEWGATHLIINTMGCGYETTTAHINALSIFAEMFGLS
jgi:hypothetical protein